MLETTKKKAGYGAVVFVLSLTTLMSTIDSNIVNVGLPSISVALNASFVSLQWIALSYLLAVTSLIVGIGRIGDIFGKKTIFIWGVVLFTVASLLCGLAASIYMLIIFRALQGIGGSILIALSFAIVGDLVPKEKLVGSINVVTNMMPIGFALGAPVGGFLISLFGWRAVFFVNVPLGILAIILAIRFPKVPVTEKIKKFDLKGMLVLTFTLICYVLSVTMAEDEGFNFNIILLAALTAAGVIVFLFLEKRVAYPLINLSLFRNKIFSYGLLVSVLLYAVLFGCSLLYPFYLQQAKGFSTALSGFLMMSGPLGCAAFTPLAGGFSKRYGNFVIMIFGIIAMCVGAFFMSTINLATTALGFFVIFFLYNGGFAFYQTPINSLIMSTAKPEQRGLASGLMNLSRTIGMTTGASAIAAIFYFFTKTKDIDTTSPANIAAGLHNTYLVILAVAVGALILEVLTFRSIKAQKEY